MKTVLSTLAATAATLAIGMTGAQAEGTLDKVMSEGVLTVSTDAAYPPQSFQNSDGDFEGFDIDVATEIANRMGVEIEFVTPAWDVITAGNWQGRWDVSVGSMTPTAQRAEVLDFPVVYYYTPAVFFVHEDSEVQEIADLNGMTLGVCSACTYENYLNKNLEMDAVGVPEFEYLVTAGEIRGYETDTNVFDDVRLGPGTRLDGGLSALPTVQEAIDNGYPMRIVGDPVFYEPLAVATDRGDPAFDAKLTEIVEAMRADGTLGELSAKWYGANLTAVE